MSAPVPLPIWALAGPLLVIGAAALAFGGVLLRRSFDALMRGATVEAEVVHRELHDGLPELRDGLIGTGKRGGATVTPYFRYHAADGSEHFAMLDHQARHRLRRDGWRLRYPLGARVPIRIDPARPSIALDTSIASMWLLPGLMTFAGLLMCLLALGMAFG